MRRAIYIPNPKTIEQIIKITSLPLTIETSALEKGIGLEGATQIAQMGFNWVYVDFFNGFPVEHDISSLKGMVHHLHQNNLKVCASIQVSSAFAIGEYAHKAWFAINTKKKKLPAGHRRFYTIIFHPEWVEEIQKYITTALECDVDGILFRDVCFGSGGYQVGNIIIGTLGSTDDITKQAYFADTGEEHIPIQYHKKSSQTYLTWRARKLYETIDYWIQHIQTQKPNCSIELETHNPIPHSSFTMQGIDLTLYKNTTSLHLQKIEAQPNIQTWIYKIIGDSLESAYTITPQVSIDNILHSKAHISPPQNLIVESAYAIAQGQNLYAQSLIKRHNKTLSSILHRRYLPYQNVLTNINQWATENREWLEHRTMASPIGIYLPIETMQNLPQKTFSVLSLVIHTLLTYGYPIHFVNEDEKSLEYTQALLILPMTSPPNMPQNIKPIYLAQRKKNSATIWAKFPNRRFPVRLLYIPSFMMNYINPLATSIAYLYHNHYTIQKILLRLFSQNRQGANYKPSSLNESMIQELINAIPPTTSRVEASKPIFYTLWREPDGTLQHHIINLNLEPQRVTLHIGELVHAYIYDLNSKTEPTTLVGSSLTIQLQNAKVIRTQSADIQTVTDVKL